MNTDGMNILNKKLVEDINSKNCNGVVYTHNISNTDNFTNEYKSYSDINVGNIIYYTDKKNQDPFDNAFFSKEGKTVIEKYTEPNGNLRCRYGRVLDKKCCPVSNNNCDVSGGYCLSSIKDSQTFREDIIAGQMRPYNEHIFNPLCGCNTNKNN